MNNIPTGASKTHDLVDIVPLTSWASPRSIQPQIIFIPDLAKCISISQKIRMI